ncbi:SMP-30/gluconolactonase/LRE family protein [Sphingomonas turrisvirgatae]|uniref:SMP-30/Gluconolactonase/LRE-like region domain-containing protein n=1 Tax=Sphingomonas turrisvirgatae TaxID=1888892 RepID=A0A1E3LVL1_9SPHN|nr:SMP-30/gluconolactonase/LRE family protein [Sphingomonas turrisvirgatae]ODP37802.1 hypothetical protein BFL28_02215 [Sphingomonas turrisvirgatae]
MKRAVLLALSSCLLLAASRGSTLPLPNAISFPEGIAITRDGRAAFVAGSSDGTIARIDLATGRGTVLPEALRGQVSIGGAFGMKVDDQDRLWIAGGRSRNIYVVDPQHDRRIATIATDPEIGLINDAAIAGGRIWFTDSRAPVLWSVDLSKPLPDTATRWMRYDGTPLQYGEGGNLNGIAAAGPDTLIVVQANKGLLFRIDTRARRVEQIDLGGETLPGSDGLVLDRGMLYVVRTEASEIVSVQLDRAYRTGKVVSRFKAPEVRLPATAAKVGDELIVVNAQLAHRADNDPVRPFTLARVPLKLLSGKAAGQR